MPGEFAAGEAVPDGYRGAPDEAGPRRVEQRALADEPTEGIRPATDVQYDRFIDGQTRWLQDMLWETALRERGERLDVNTYLALRLGTVGIYATIAQFGLVGGTEITAQEFASPLFRAVIESGLYAATLGNDRYSYFKESEGGQLKYNIFTALMVEHPQWTERQAMTEGIVIRDRMAQV
ncbi:terpene synthase family protein [Streptomyces sp. NBC_00212]|uniref:terpene synthase family protein n=1 Tax=Streptomyces sp. NBC_00212 TaxID=2975684 RepID=UPI00324DF7EC